MDLTKVPAGFALALAQSNAAMDAFAAMNPDQKQMVLEKARHARSQAEMQQVVYTLAGSPL